MTNEIQATDFVTLFITDKKQRESFVNQVIEAVESGNINPLDVQVGLKGFEKISESVMKHPLYKDALMGQASIHGKSFEYKGAKVEQVESGVKYDYSVCNDAVIDELLLQVDRLNEAVKARQSMLKTIPAKGIEVLNEETGEVATIYPPAKSSTSTLKVTI